MTYICNSVTKLKAHLFISKLVAAVLVLLLILGVTPKYFLHEVFADHKDTTSCNDVKTDSPCIHNQGYSCVQSDLVVPNFYVIAAAQYIVTDVSFYVETHSPFSSFLSKNFVTHTQERAPPVSV